MSQPRSNLDGVVNPTGLLEAGASVIFLVAVPITSYLTTPHGVINKVLDGTLSTLAYAGSAGATSTLPAGRAIPALAALYIAFTYAITGAASAAGVSAAHQGGRDNSHPRAQVGALKGLPLRLHSAHYNLMEMFPGWALVAALTQALAPENQQLVNLLGLHVVAKCFVHYPSYLLNVHVPRSAAHVVATGAIINVAWRLAQGAV